MSSFFCECDGQHMVAVAAGAHDPWASHEDTSTDSAHWQSAAKGQLSHPCGHSNRNLLLVRVPVAMMTHAAPYP